MEDRVTLDGWNSYLVTFMFNHIPGPPPKKLKLMDNVFPRRRRLRHKLPPSRLSSQIIW